MVASFIDDPHSPQAQWWPERGPSPRRTGTHASIWRHRRSTLCFAGRCAPTAPPKSTQRVPHRGDMSSSAFNSHFGAAVAPSRGAINLKEITHDQSEARSPDTAELPAHLHRPAAADGVRRAVDRPPGAEEQRRRPRQGGEGVQDPDHHHHGRDARASPATPIPSCWTCSPTSQCSSARR